MHELITLNVHVHLPFTWTQQVISAFIGPSTCSHRPMQYKIHLLCTRVSSCIQLSPSINIMPYLHNSPTWRRLKCCKIESLAIPKGTKFIFLQKIQIWNSIAFGWIFRSKVPRPSSFDLLKFLFAKGTKESDSILHNPKVLLHWILLRISSYIAPFALILCCLKSSL
jgi:hypothetical protein